MMAKIDQAELDAHIQRIVAQAPPLTPEQRDRLAMLFRPGPENETAIRKDEWDV